MSSVEAIGEETALRPPISDLRAPGSNLRAPTSGPRAPTPLAAPAFSGYDPPPMHVDIRKAQDVVIVDFEGRLAAGVGDEILGEVIQQLITDGYKKILLNFSKVDYIDSMGLGELVRGYKLAQREGAGLRLLKPQDRIKKTLSLSKLLPLFPIHDSEADALQCFANSVKG